MKVKAIKTGYYGIKRRKAGSVFSIKKEQDFSDRWMERLDEVSPSQKVEEVVAPVESESDAEMASGDEEVL